MMSMPQMSRSTLATAMLVTLAVFSTTACSTTASDAAAAGVDATGAASSASSQETRDQDTSANQDASSADAGASASSDGQPATTTREFSMRPGDSVDLPDNGSLRYMSMVNDSRCMPNVQCIWAGNAELSFRWQRPGGGQETFSLNTSSRGGPTTHALGKQRVELVSLARGPAPEARLRVEPAS